MTVTNIKTGLPPVLDVEKTDGQDRSIDTGETERYIELLNPQRVRRIYLDELGSTSQPSIGIETVKLVIEPEATVGAKARALIDQARLEITDETVKGELIQLIERIIVYKFPKKVGKR